jgi:hypothetical protein
LKELLTERTVYPDVFHCPHINLTEDASKLSTKASRDHIVPDPPSHALDRVWHSKRLEVPKNHLLSSLQVKSKIIFPMRMADKWWPFGLLDFLSTQLWLEERVGLVSNCDHWQCFKLRQWHKPQLA